MRLDDFAAKTPHQQRELLLTLAVEAATKAQGSLLETVDHMEALTLALVDLHGGEARLLDRRAKKLDGQLLDALERLQAIAGETKALREKAAC